MKNSIKNRLAKVEAAIEKKLNPFSDKGDILLVLPDKGETPEQKLAEREKELGYKLNRSKVIYFCVYGIT
jgi:hypothetical protein